MIGLGLVDELGGLLAVDVFGKLTVKKSVLHVELMNRPAMRGG
jgi:hypothetical protein